jgi:hypothetical protein
MDQASSRRRGTMAGRRRYRSGVAGLRGVALAGRWTISSGLSGPEWTRVDGVDLGLRAVQGLALLSASIRGSALALIRVYSRPFAVQFYLPSPPTTRPATIGYWLFSERTSPSRDLSSVMRFARLFAMRFASFPLKLPTLCALPSPWRSSPSLSPS